MSAPFVGHREEEEAGQKEDASLYKDHTPKMREAGVRQGNVVLTDPACDPKKPGS